MTRPQFSRISITLPPDALESADRLARALNRSRSWVMAEAIRRFEHPITSPEATPPSHATGATPVAAPTQILAFDQFEGYRAWNERTPPEGQLDRALAAALAEGLNREGARYLLVGAGVRTLRASDGARIRVALLIEASTENAIRVLRQLERAGLALAREWIAEGVAGRAATVIAGPFRVDVLTRLGERDYDRAARGAGTDQIEGVSIPTLGGDRDPSR